VAFLDGHRSLENELLTQLLQETDQIVGVLLFHGKDSFGHSPGRRIVVVFGLVRVTS
jgi:hypothetical protein